MAGTCGNADIALLLAGYLEAVSERLVVDLVAVSAYEVGGQKVLVPQRVDPGREREERVARVTRMSTSTTRYIEGGAEFVAAIETSPVQYQQTLKEIVEWAEQLEREHLARLATTIGRQGAVLRVLLPNEGSGFVTVYSYQASMTIWGPKLHRQAPASVARIQAVLAPKVLKESGGFTAPDAVTPELLDALTGAYREAAEEQMPQMLDSELSEAGQVLDTAVDPST